MSLVRTWVRDVLGKLLYLLRVTRLPRRHANRLTIVTFHRVLPPTQLADYPLRNIAVTPDELGWFLDVLDRYFDCASLVEATALWDSGASSKPPLAITFDDGQLDNYLHARPVLERLGLKSTFFVTVHGAESGALLWHDRMAYSVLRLLRSSDSALQDLLGAFGSANHTDPFRTNDQNMVAARAVEKAKHWSPRERGHWLERADLLLGSVAPSWDGMMTGAELKAMVDAGHEIGCHSHSHEILPDLEDAKLLNEIVRAKARLEELTGKACTSFCYPNGDNDSRCARLVRENYASGVTTQWGTNLMSADRALLRRIDMVAPNTRSGDGNLSVQRLAWRMSGLYPGLR